MKNNLETLLGYLLEVETAGSDGKNRFTHDYPLALTRLAAEARKAGSYEEFKRDYMIEGKRGLYWHITENKDFKIDPEKGPQDKSAAGFGSIGVGDLMFTSDLGRWSGHYGKSRKYVALLDLSNVERSRYRSVARGFGNEFYLADASNSGIKVEKVVTIGTAKRIAKAYEEILPRSYDELQNFYYLIKGST